MARAPGRRDAQGDRGGSGEPMGWPAWADPIAITTLRERIRADQIGHAYLLTGPRGVGKQALALAVCQALCCTDNASGDPSLPCGACRACRNVSRKAHPDVEWWGLEAQALMADKPTRGANLTIDTIRRLRASAALLPLESQRRVIVIDDAETMMEPAQQALLKTLEEPPPAVTLILLADEPEALLETVRSRCQTVVVRPAPESTIRRELANRHVDGDLAEEIATLSRGRPAWAIAAVDDRRLLQSRRDERDAAEAWLKAPRYEQLVTAYRQGEQFAKRREDVFGAVQSATEVLRREMISAASDGSQELPAESIYGGDHISVEVLGRAVSASLRCLADLDANVRPRLALEAMVMAWPNLEPQPV